MKNFCLSLVVIIFGFSIVLAKGKEIENPKDKGIYPLQIPQKTTVKNYISTLDNITINRFFKKYSNLKKYLPDVIALYKKRNYNPIWYDDKGLIEFASLLYSKVSQLEDEGIKSKLAYIDRIAAIFNNESEIETTQTEKELLLSSMYIYYAKKVFHGIDTEKIQETGWFLPRKETSYKILLDSLLVDSDLLNKNEKQLFGQYYKLRDALLKYRQIEQSGEWTPIETDSLLKDYKPGDSSKTIGQIRHRLLITADLKQDSKSNFYDQDLMEGILNFKRRNGYKSNYIIGSQHINRMNLPIDKYIKTIMVNMERCRWIPPELSKDDEFIIVNIPSFKLLYKKQGQTVLESKVFVGVNMLETVIFSSSISRIVFSPYWNVPRSIIENEFKPAMKNDPDYLVKNNLEWNRGNIRQKPGAKNALGLVKFVFPNTYDIYLHDTPFKTNFESEMPLFSHGCINMQKAKELAILILEDDPNWPIERINEAMLGEKETSYTLKKKIPIHIGYFTTWVNDTGEISFYFDIYQKDSRLAEFLFADDSN